MGIKNTCRARAAAEQFAPNVLPFILSAGPVTVSTQQAVTSHPAPDLAPLLLDLLAATSARRDP